MFHYLEAIRSYGSVDGSNTESPECFHINYTKDAYWATNKCNYIEQMLIWLRCQEAVDQFTVYLEWLTTTDHRGDDLSPDSDDDDDDDSSSKRREAVAEVNLSKTFEVF
jgi:hypothetical protein